MNPIIKQPNVKLIPSDPMTNTILIIYCVSSTGVSVPYKSAWRKINPKKNKVQDIKSHNGSSYRCSPLDLDCIIQVTIFFQFQNMQLQKTVQSNMVKVSRQLKERRNYIKDHIPCKISIDQMPIQAKIIFQDAVLFVFPATTNISQASFALHCNDFVPQADSNQHTFKLFLRNNFEDFLKFFSGLLGWRPQIRSQFFLFTFTSDINRDIILLGFAEVFQRSIDFQTIQVPKIVQQNSQLQKLGNLKNKSKKSLSPLNKQKIKVNQKVQMKKSQSNLSQQKNQTFIKDKNNQSFLKENKVTSMMKQKKIEPVNNIGSPVSKVMLKQKGKETRDYLNVFESDDEELLTPVNKTADNIIKNEPFSLNKPNPPKEGQNQPSINLRGSFEQLQRSFSNNNEEAIQKVFGNIDSNSKRMQQQLFKLKKQNEQLRKQSQLAAALSKQNMQIKKKYHELKQQINRLQMQRKVILTDKLRCQVNWHKQTQQKQFFKKQVQNLREMLKGGINLNSQNQIQRIKSTSIHQFSNTQRQKQRNRSPNSSFYNK